MKVSAIKKALAPLFKDRLKQIWWVYSWNNVLSNEKQRRLVLQVENASDEQQEQYKALAKDVNATILANAPDSGVVFEIEFVIATVEAY